MTAAARAEPGGGAQWGAASTLRECHAGIAELEAPAGEAREPAALSGAPVLLLATVHDAAAPGGAGFAGRMIVPLVRAGLPVDQWFMLQGRDGLQLRTPAGEPAALRLRFAYGALRASAPPMLSPPAAGEGDAPLPPGWEKKLDPSGKVPPRPAPPPPPGARVTRWARGAGVFCQPRDAHLLMDATPTRRRLARRRSCRRRRSRAAARGDGGASRPGPAARRARARGRGRGGAPARGRRGGAPARGRRGGAPARRGGCGRGGAPARGRRGGAPARRAGAAARAGAGPSPGCWAQEFGGASARTFLPRQRAARTGSAARAVPSAPLSDPRSGPAPARSGCSTSRRCGRCARRCGR